MIKEAKQQWKTEKNKDIFNSWITHDTMSYNNMELLRFTTAWSVDDGKSTLIGRLLHDTKSIFEDQMEAIEATSKRKGEEEVNLAYLTDGLKAEREQGITIDVAYRYFATPKRKFIIADTPGHIQYTRNMVTGASTANVALILIDARQWVLEQTARHTFIASLLGIPHVIFCINKMDLVDWSEEVFEKIKAEAEGFASKLTIQDIHFVPMSALKGDNVADKSDNMPRYKGGSLLYLLETIHIGSDHNHIDCRFPVQYVIRPQSDEYHDYRGYAGTIAGWVFKPGDEVTILPSGFNSTIKAIEIWGKDLQEAFSPQSVVMTLTDDIDISRGDMIVRPKNQPTVSQDIDVMICRFHKKPLQLNGKYGLRHTTKMSRCVVKEVSHKIDVNTMHRQLDDTTVGMNDIARVTLRTMDPLFFDAYQRNRYTGSIILIDEATNETVAAGMIV